MSSPQNIQNISLHIGSVSYTIQYRYFHTLKGVVHLNISQIRFYSFQNKSSHAETEGLMSSGKIIVLSDAVACPHSDV